MEIDLTKDADMLICLIYKDYLNKREAGMSKSSAKAYSSRSDFPESLTDHFSISDIRDTLRELKAAGLIRSYSYSGFALSDKAIVYMENRFPRGVSQVLDWFAKIKSAVPFL